MIATVATHPNPFQGLKRLAVQTTTRGASSCNSPKSLSGIETANLQIR